MESHEYLLDQRSPQNFLYFWAGRSVKLHWGFCWFYAFSVHNWWWPGPLCQVFLDCLHINSGQDWIFASLLSACVIRTDGTHATVPSSNASYMYCARWPAGGGGGVARCTNTLKNSIGRRWRSMKYAFADSRTYLLSIHPHLIWWKFEKSVFSCFSNCPCQIKKEQNDIFSKIFFRDWSDKLIDFLLRMGRGRWSHGSHGHDSLCNHWHIFWLRCKATQYLTQRIFQRASPFLARHWENTGWRKYKICSQPVVTRGHSTWHDEEVIKGESPLNKIMHISLPEFDDIHSIWVLKWNNGPVPPIGIVSFSTPSPTPTFSDLTPTPLYNTNYVTYDWLEECLDSTQTPDTSPCTYLRIFTLPVQYLCFDAGPTTIYTGPWIWSDFSGTSSNILLQAILFWPRVGMGPQTTLHKKKGWGTVPGGGVTWDHFQNKRQLGRMHVIRQQ
jgi:hypothetical protein